MKAKDTCGKRRFPDEYEAGKRLKQLTGRAERNGYTPPLRYYWHWKCGGFHLTSEPLKEEEEIVTWVIGDPSARDEPVPGL
jgi:hypothetical protein